jgi:succinoglycan biosynthesis transport protein ExoP
VQINSSPSAQEDEANNASALALRKVVAVLRRRWTWIAMCAATFAISAGLYSAAQPPVYTAEAALVLEARQLQVVNIQAVMTGLPTDFAAIRSELDVLSSDDILKRVIAQLNLKDNPEFNPKASRTARMGSAMGGWLETALNAINASEWLPRDLADWLLSSSNADASDVDKEVISAQSTLDNLNRHLRVFNDGRSYTLHVQVDSRSPETASNIANAIAKIYIEQQLETKWSATRKATAWLNQRLAELREQVRVADTKIQNYRESHKLIEAKGTSISAQQLSELNTQIVLARSERLQAEARYKRIHDLQISGAGLNAAREVLSSTLIERLREQESDLQRRETQLSEIYDDKHPKIISIRKEIQDFKRNIQEEIGKVAQLVQNDVQVARAREASLSSAIEQLQQSTADVSRAEVELRELQREADANRNLYNTFLSRSKETTSQEDLQRPDARIISPAEPPKAPSSLGLLPITGSALFLGLLFGTFTALLLDRLTNSYESSVQLHLDTRLPVFGTVPNLDPKKDGAPQDAVIRRPNSAFSESLRSVRTAMRFLDADRPVQVLLVTSSIVAEGKTTFCAALGRSIAQNGGRVLLIDCDLRRPKLGRALGMEPVANLQDALSNQVTLDRLIGVDKKTGLHFVSAVSDAVNAQSLFGSKQMESFLKQMKQHYDLIIIDSPPVMAVSDAVVLAGLADCCVFLVAWAKTRRDIVSNALALLQTAKPKAVGLVLSRVDLRRHRKLNYSDQAYYYGTYGEYYIN